jgi:hypothetical protein
MKKAIQIPGAPAPIGPYSQAILKNDTLFLTDGKGQSNGEYIYFENQTIIYTDVYVNKSPIYKIVGHLSEKPKLKNSMKDVLTRLEKLESLIKSN